MAYEFTPNEAYSASRMLYTGEAVSAEEALRAGICEYIAPCIM